MPEQKQAAVQPWPACRGRPEATARPPVLYEQTRTPPAYSRRTIRASGRVRRVGNNEARLPRARHGNGLGFAYGRPLRVVPSFCWEVLREASKITVVLLSNN